MSALGESERLWISGPAACEHGSRCSCRALARAIGVPESAIDFNYCRRVLQNHWRMNCDHLPPLAARAPVLSVPPHDSHDPVQVLLIVNADRTGEEPARP